MEKEKVFLGALGISSSSAENICSVLTEMVKDAEKRIEKISMVNVSITTVTSEADAKLMKQGYTEEQLKSIISDLERSSKAAGFKAWLREAIKAKEQIISDIEKTDLSQYADATGRSQEYAKFLEELPPYPTYEKEALEELGITAPEAPAGTSPTSKAAISKNIRNSKSTKELSEYLEAEAFAATFGKAIHGSDSSLTRAFEELHNAMAEPIEADYDNFIKYKVPSVPADVATSVYSEVQAKYREFECNLNRLKHLDKEKTEEIYQKESKTAKNLASEYEEKLKNYLEIIDRIGREYSNKSKKHENARKVWTQDHQSWISSEITRISNLKIIIPERFGTKSGKTWTGIMGEVMKYLGKKDA